MTEPACITPDRRVAIVGSAISACLEPSEGRTW
jgi:hypothetical protein